VTSGRSVLVTGANSGIGLATALELAGAGWQVFGSVRSEGKAEVVRTAAEARGLEVGTVLLDVDDAQSCADAVREVEERSGGLSALVNNAGYAQSGAVEDVPDELVHAQLETNVVAPVRLARLVLPGMRERGDGRIVNVSSVAGRLSTPLMGWN
jgi:NAD(P)-dependent dehydrogenase (short-subunit alcohol dehydrogenase family)